MAATTIQVDEDDDDSIPFELPESKPSVKPISSASLKREKQTAPKVSSLEDLYAEYPVGDGAHFIRVTRLSPKQHMGVNITGVIGDFDFQMPLSEFINRFGGGRYSVAVIGPFGSENEDGTRKQRQLHEVFIPVQGLPKMPSREQAQEEDVMVSAGYAYRGMSAGEPAAVAVTRLKLEADRDKAQQAALEKAHSTPEHVTAALKDAAERTVQQVRELSDQRADILHQQNVGLLNKVGELDADLKLARQSLLEEQQHSIAAVRNAELELEKRLRELFDSNVRNLMDSHSKELSELKSLWAKDVASTREQASRDIISLKDQIQRESSTAETRHQAQLNDASRRYQEDMARLSRDNDREIQRLREQYDNRIVDIKTASEREIKSVRDDRERALSDMRKHHEIQVSFATEANSVRSEVSNAELARLRSDSERLRSENDKMRKESIKDPVTYLNETREVAVNLLGMIDAKDVPTGGGEEEWDWKKTGAKAVMELISKLPETARAITEQVGAARQQNSAQAAPAQAGAMAVRGGGRRRMAPVPDGGWQGAPPAHVGPVHGYDIPFQQPYAPIHRPLEPSVVATVPLEQPAAQQPEMSVQPTPAQVDQRNMEEFISQLHNAIETDVQPGMFAQMLVATIGKESASQFLGSFKVDDFLEQLEKHGGGGSISTMKGRRFTREMWAEVDKLVKQG